MNRLDRIFGWIIFGMGVLHCGVTFVLFSGGREGAMWFFSGGLAMVYGAALNLLRVRYAGVAPGVRTACALVNLSLLGFIVAFLADKGVAAFRNPGSVVLCGSVAAVTAFSLWSKSPAAPPAVSGQRP